MDDKISNAARKLIAQGKEATSHAIGDENQKAEDQGDQAQRDLRQAGEKFKDGFKKN
ncbi:CsbD family protein [Arthrobacter sp. MDT2-2]